MASDVEVLRELGNMTVSISRSSRSTQGEIERALEAAISALEAREARPKVEGRMTDAELDANHLAAYGEGLLAYTWRKKPDSILYAVVLEARRARASEAALFKRVEELEKANVATKAVMEQACRDLDAWGHDRDCARLQARGRPNDDSVLCDCNLEPYGFGRPHAK